MKTVIKNFFKEKERELVAKVLLFMLVPFIVIGCGGSEAGGTASFDVNVTEVITHKGITYATVTSPYTGKVWLDRNLGASQVCTSSTDTACYGDYYEWGRLTDGHEKTTSTVTATQASDISNAGAEFIDDGTMGDWASVGADEIGSLRGEQWSKTDGTSVCPVGFRVPSISELLAETTTLTSNDEGIDNFLKLPKSGQRTFNNLSVGNQIQLWSSTHLDTASVSSSFLYVSDMPPAGSRDMSAWRTYGLAVRCLKH